MKDNNTYTGDGDDLDLVALEEKINRERKKKGREIETDRVEKSHGSKKRNTVKNCGEDEIGDINNINNNNNITNAQAEEEEGEFTEGAGTDSTHNDRK